MFLIRSHRRIVKSMGATMSERVQPFGGEHTRRKLDVVAKYLAAYVTVMKKQEFRLFYVDGFAGSGASTSKAEAEKAQDPTLFPSAGVLDGSPNRALSVEPPFDHYVFVDKSDKNVRSLASLRDKFPRRNIEIAPGDANDRIVEFCDRISSQRFDRAVVFLDPFGLSVRWATMERLAATRKVDLWYLVPVDGMSRQIKEDGTFLPGAAKIDEIWGSAGWRNKAVRRAETSDDLFGEVDERLEKIARAKQFSEMFREHLQDVFAGGVSNAYLPLGRGRRHDFSLMFACANPSPAASGTAMRIANHILRTA
jgi:three-Cys-motif partner protein